MFLLLHTAFDFSFTFTVLLSLHFHIRGNDELKRVTDLPGGMISLADGSTVTSAGVNTATKKKPDDTRVMVPRVIIKEKFSDK